MSTQRQFPKVLRSPLKQPGLCALLLLACFTLSCQAEAPWSEAQENTLRDMKTLATSYGDFLLFLANGNPHRPARLNMEHLDHGEAVDCATGSLELVPWAFLEGLLVPDFASSLPQKDQWGRAFEVRGSGVRLAIRSAGPDGQFEPHAQWDCGTFVSPTTEDSGDDLILVWLDGVFLRWYLTDSEVPKS